MIDLLFYSADIWQNEIIGWLDLKSIIRLMQTCHYFCDNLYVIDLCNIDYKLKIKITDTVLKQKKFMNIKYLDASNNRYVTTVNHFDKLVVLNAEGSECGIDQKGISKLENLEELHLFFNFNITDINHLKKLKILDLKFGSGVKQQGISELKNLTELDVYDNSDIYDINHLEKLEVLDIGSSYYSVINQEGISNLVNLVKLYTVGNSEIKDVNHLKKLKVLHAAYSGIVRNGIRELTELVELKWED